MEAAWPSGLGCWCCKLDGGLGLKASILSLAGFVSQ